MKRILFAAMLATLGQGASARDFPYPIKDGLSAVVTTSGDGEERATVRVGNGPEQLLGVFDEEIDQMGSVDINHDGYRDLVLGQSGGSTQIIARLFLYRPGDGGFQEILHPDSKASPCHGFVNPDFDPGRAAFSVACRYGAASNGFENYVLRPDGTAHATSWATQALFALEVDQADLTYRFREDGSVAGIDIEGEGSPLDGGTVPVGRLDLYDTPDVNARPTMTAAEGEHLEVVALRPRDWLQVRYASKSAGEVLKWVRYGDLRVDKHQYRPSPPDATGLELTLFNYLGDWNDEESGGRFTLRLDNRGPAPARLVLPRVWLLLINAQGDRIVQPLFQRDAVTLEAPGAPAQATATGLADTPVLWRKDEDDGGRLAYMIRAGDAGYVPVVPGLAAGRYRATAVVTDPGNLGEPLYSNQVEFDFPFPKRP
ncbi:SH3 domain-containing protein [Achromobacter deleyi]|uniref:SH3 domain-containing protein n=1 Tax=Achromobacter deleyi TaxID=1353891 RepID=UPI00149301DE|nr:SH3 domain-containing protein [Achromobacter deleyi]QVQ26470.1 SH3 domain-containing protein [Achromobacter deleyi]UIP22040.1 SH3 domain-containing protein [Achromobacter deleyi]